MSSELRYFGIWRSGDSRFSETFVPTTKIYGVTSHKIRVLVLTFVLSPHRNLNRNDRKYETCEWHRNTALSKWNCACHQQSDNWHAERQQGPLVQLMICIYHAWGGPPKLFTWLIKATFPPPSRRLESPKRKEQCWPLKTYLFTRRGNHCNCVVYSNNSGMKYLFTLFQKLLTSSVIMSLGHI